ncbi:MAG: TonB-dependent receptor [Chitinophagales bacterium]
MKRLQILLITYFLSQVLSAQENKITGQILNEENQSPVTGAYVVAKDYLLVAYTDENGNFELSTKRISSDSFTLNISHISFQKKQLIVSKQKTNLTISLSPKTILSEEVIVSSTRANRNISTTAETIEKEDFEERNLGQDIPVLLELSPSVVSTSDAGAGVGYTGLRIRGSDQTRVNVTINGIPYNDPESQGVFWVNLPDFASSVENIQVQRGVGTSTNGSGAFGGSINIQTSDLEKDEAYGEIAGSYGSFNTWKTTAKLGTGLIKDKFAFEGRFSKIKSNGFVDRASSNLTSGFLSGGYFGEKTIIKANIFTGKEITYQSWWGVPEDSLSTNRQYNYYNYDNQVDNYQQNHYQLHISQELHEKLLLNVALHYTRGKGYFEEYKGSEYNNDDGFNSKQRFSSYGLDNVIIGSDTIERTSLIRRRHYNNRFYGSTFSLIYEPNNKSNITLGGAWNQNDGDHYGEVIWAEFASNGEKGHRYYENAGIKTDFNVYAKGHYRILRGLSAFVDLQYRHVGYATGGINRDLSPISEERIFHFFNPKAGISYAVNERNRFNASFAIANREPVRRDIVDAPANKTPKAEQLRNLELGYEFSLSKWRLSLNYYWMGYKDQLVLTGDVNDVGGSIRTNVDESYRTGIELQSKLKIIDQLEWDFNFTYSANKIRSFEEYVPVDFGYSGFDTIQHKNTDISFSPSIISASQFSYIPVEGLKISLINKYVGRQYLDNSSNIDRSIDPYFLTHVSLNYHWKIGKFIESVDFNLLLNNIFNTEYESNGYTFSSIDGQTTERADYNYYYPQAGFNLLGGIRVRF